MHQPTELIADDLLTATVLTIGYHANPDFKRRIVRQYTRLERSSEEALAWAQVEVLIEAPNLTFAPHDPTAIIAVVSVDYELEAILGDYLPASIRERGRGRGVDWLGRAMGCWMPGRLAEECHSKRTSIRRRSLDGLWSGIAVPTLSGGSILAFFSLNPAGLVTA